MENRGSTQMRVKGQGFRLQGLVFFWGELGFWGREGRREGRRRDLIDIVEGQGRRRGAKKAKMSGRVMTGTGQQTKTKMKPWTEQKGAQRGPRVDFPVGRRQQETHNWGVWFFHRSSRKGTSELKSTVGVCGDSAWWRGGDCDTESVVCGKMIKVRTQPKRTIEIPR